MPRPQDGRVPKTVSFAVIRIVVI